MNFNNTTAVFFEKACQSVRCMFSFTEKNIIATAFFAVIIVSLTGNISICYIIMRKKLLSSTANLSTLNLAVSDLLITIVCAPVITIDFYIADRWVFGELLCKVVPVVQKIAVNASIINLFVISLEKFLAVCFPFCFRTRKRYFAYGLPLVWLLSIGIAAPLGKYRKQVTISSSSYCIPDFPDLETVRIFAVVSALSFFVPLIIMLFLQMTTIYSLRRKGITKGIPYMSKHNIRRKKAAVVLIIVILSFLACWTPIYVVSMLGNFSEVMSSIKVQTLNILYAVFTWMFYLCAAIHPLIYFLMTPQGNKTLKKHFKKPKGQKALRRKQVARPFRSTIPSSAGSNIGSVLFTRESRV
jgi:hypothetical protein